jgi:GTP-binding protein HflX
VLAVSGMTGEGLDELLHAIDAALTRDPLETADFRIPQAEGRVIAALERGATIMGQRFEGNLVFLTAVGPASLLQRYTKYQNRHAGEHGEADQREIGVETYVVNGEGLN